MSFTQVNKTFRDIFAVPPNKDTVNLHVVGAWSEGKHKSSKLREVSEKQKTETSAPFGLPKTDLNQTL